MKTFETEKPFLFLFLFLFFITSFARQEHGICDPFFSILSSFESFKMDYFLNFFCQTFPTNLFSFFRKLCLDSFSWSFFLSIRVSKTLFVLFRISFLHKLVFGVFFSFKTSFTTVSIKFAPFYLMLLESLTRYSRQETMKDTPANIFCAFG